MEQCFPAFSSVVHFALAVFTAWEFGWTVICGLKPAATRCHRVGGERNRGDAAYATSRIIVGCVRGKLQRIVDWCIPMFRPRMRAQHVATGFSLWLRET